MVSGTQSTLATPQGALAAAEAGAAPTIGNLPTPIVYKKTAVGLASAGAVTVAGTKVGDKVIAAIGFVTSTGVIASLAAEASFEATVTVAGQIQQSGSTLNANTYLFLLQARS